MGTEKWKNRSKRPEERAYECKPYIQTIERREKAGDETKRESRKGGHSVSQIETVGGSGQTGGNGLLRRSQLPGRVLIPHLEACFPRRY